MVGLTREPCICRTCEEEGEWMVGLTREEQEPCICRTCAKAMTHALPQTDTPPHVASMGTPVCVSSCQCLKEDKELNVRG
jgi:hypothetical protein